MLGGLKNRLMHPDLVAVFVEEYRRAWNEAQAGQVATRAKSERDLVQVDRKIAGILSAIEDGMYDPSMKTRMEELKVEKARLTSNLAHTPEPPALRLHPGLAGSYRAKIANLASSLSNPTIQLQAMEALRDLISEVRLVPDTNAEDGHHIELVGDLASILALQEAGTPKAPRVAGYGVGYEANLQVRMVAGVGFEPTTFRL